MAKVNAEIIDLIIQNTLADERDKHIILHLLNGGKQRDCIWEDKALNPNTVSTARNRYISYIQFERNGEVSIVESLAPEWLKNSDLYTPEPVLFAPEKAEVKKQVILLNDHIQDLGNLRTQMEKERATAVLEAINEQKALSQAKCAEIERNNAELLQEVISDLNNKHQLAVNLLLKKHAEDSAVLKQNCKLKYTKETTEIYQRQQESLNSKFDVLQGNYDQAKQQITDLNADISRLNADKQILKTDIDVLISKNSENDSLIEKLQADVLRLQPKWDRSFILQSFVSVGWLLGLLALSIFSVENMLIYFNAGSFWLVALILGVFIEYMLWATNITRFAGSLDDLDSQYSSQELSTVIFVFRAFANSLGGYYIATNASELVKGSGLYASLSTKFTDINELYFGFEVGGTGMVVTAIIIGGFVAYMEYKALPLAIRHAYNLFIKKI